MPTFLFYRYHHASMNTELPPNPDLLKVSEFAVVNCETRLDIDTSIRSQLKLISITAMISISTHQTAAKMLFVAMTGCYVRSEAVPMQAQF